MKNILAYLLLSSLAFAGACASTTQPDPDGQTHWMTRCDEDADCGELSCICGVCTETCKADDECSAGESVATCSAASDVLDTAACTKRQATASVCAPLCERQKDCDAVASDLMCLSDGVCALEDRAPLDEDAAVPGDTDGGDGDAAIDEESAPRPIELACDEDGNLVGEGSFEVVVSGDFGGALAIAADGTIFGTGRIDGVYGSAFRVVDGEVDPFGMELWELQRILIDGSVLIAGKSDGDEATVTATRIDSQEKLTLARQDALNVPELTADDDAVYWVAQLSQDPVRSALWRSPRVPGESVLLAEMFGYVSDLVALNDDLFFFGSPTGSYQLMRIAKDGSSGGALEALEVPENAGGLRTDGRDLFFALHDVFDNLGNPVPGERGIVRMDPVTLEMETVADTGEDQPTDLVAGGRHVYWTIDRATRDFEPRFELWRGASDGSGAPQQLGTLETYAGPFAEHNGRLYWISTCRTEASPHFSAASGVLKRRIWARS